MVFVSERMAVAARLQAHARNWSNAYQILRRLHAYGQTPAIDFDYNDVAVLAAIETALVECAQLGATRIVLAESVPDHVLDRMRVIEGVPFIRAGGIGPEDGRRAYCSLGPAPDASMRPGDFSFDILPGLDRFPLFATQAG